MSTTTEALAAEPKKERSALRIYVDRNKIGLALGAVLLGAGGVGGVPLMDRLVAGAQAAEKTAERLAAVEEHMKAVDKRLDDTEAKAANLQERQGRQENTAARIDDNVQAVCRALKIQCKERPARPE